MKDTAVLKVFSFVFILSFVLFPLGQVYAEDSSAPSVAPSAAVSETPGPDQSAIAPDDSLPSVDFGQQLDLAPPVGDDLPTPQAPADQINQNANQPAASADAADKSQSEANQNSKKITPGPTANSTTINPGAAAPFNPAGSVQTLQAKDGFEHRRADVRLPI
jgi:hypothetical protein